MTLFRRILTAPLRVYRRWLSPLKPPMCRFSPTCSQYAITAIETHGFLRGSGLAAWRILRCNPLCEGGHDPVPPPRDAARRETGPRARARDPGSPVDSPPVGRQDPRR